jgi:hypothetical protein
MQKVSSLSPTKHHRAPYQLMSVRWQAWHLKKSPTRGIRSPRSAITFIAFRGVFCRRTLPAVCHGEFSGEQPAAILGMTGLCRIGHRAVRDRQLSGLSASLLGGGVIWQPEKS